MLVTMRMCDKCGAKFEEDKFCGYVLKGYMQCGSEDTRGEVELDICSECAKNEFFKPAEDPSPAMTSEDYRKALLKFCESRHMCESSLEGDAAECPLAQTFCNDNTVGAASFDELKSAYEQIKKYLK